MNRLILAGVAAASLFCLAGARPAVAQNAPFAGRGGPDIKDPKAEKLEAEAKKLDAQLKAKPKDAKLKEKTAEAYYQAGHAYEYSKVALRPAVRYRTALKLYRLALALNPKHAKAAAEKKQIEDIYTNDLHMPIPKT